MLTKEEKKHLRWIEKTWQAMLYHFLYITAINEPIIETLIADLICRDKDKADKIIKYVILPMSFNSKIKTLKKILKETERYYYDKHIKDIESLEKLYSYRSLLAHATLNTDEREIKKLDTTRIPFENAMRSGQIMYLNLVDIQNKLDEMFRLNNVLVAFDIKINPERESKLSI